MAIRIAQKHCDQCIRAPLVFNEIRPSIKRNDAGKCPYILPDGNQSSLVELFAYPGNAEKSDDVQDGRRDDQKLNVKGVEAERAED